VVLAFTQQSFSIKSFLLNLELKNPGKIIGQTAGFFIFESTGVDGENRHKL
jgi:hypothetical protein